MAQLQDFVTQGDEPTGFITAINALSRWIAIKKYCVPCNLLISCELSCFKLRIAVVLCVPTNLTVGLTSSVASPCEQTKKPFQCASWLCPSNAFHRTVIPQCFVFLLFDRLLAVGPVEWNEERCNSLVPLLSSFIVSLLSTATSPHCCSQTLSCLARINSLASGQSHFLAMEGGPRCRGTTTTKGCTTAPLSTNSHRVTKLPTLAVCVSLYSFYCCSFQNRGRCLSGCVNGMQRHNLLKTSPKVCFI